jgi:hypothetical protein
LSGILTAGGILVGVNCDVFEVISWEVKVFSISTIVKIKRSSLNIRLTTFYGSPYREENEAFISELHELFLNWDGPTMIGGDFNLVRFQTDKIKGNANQKWCDKFNAWVEIWSLLKFQVGDIPGQTTKRT